MNRKIIIFLLIGVLIGITAGKWYSASENKTEVSSDIRTGVSDSRDNKTRQTDHQIPDKVYEILKYIETFNQAKKGYVGGSVFHNYEGLLPAEDKSGTKINYREWDVNPKIKGKSRGAERLVTGDDKSAWYTGNHYKSFIKIH